MANWGYYIKKLREDRGWSQAKLADRSGLGRGHIARIEGGGYINPSRKTFEGLAKAFGMTTTQLAQIIDGKESIIPKERPEDILERLRLATPVSIPIYTEYPFHAGEATEPVEYIYRARPKMASKNIEGYIIHGHCLEPKITEGDVIIVNREGAIDEGDIVACLRDNELHLGWLRRIADELWLENNSSRSKFENCQVAAPVIEVIRRLK